MVWYCHLTNNKCVVSIIAVAPKMMVGRQSDLPPKEWGGEKNRKNLYCNPFDTAACHPLVKAAGQCLVLSSFHQCVNHRVRVHRIMWLGFDNVLFGDEPTSGCKVV